MQVNGLQNIEDQKITTIQFSRKSLDALVFTSADMICNIITLFSATSNQTTTVKTLMKTKAIYSWAKLISKIIKENQLEGGLSAKTEMEIIWELIKTSKDYLKNDIYKNLLISDLTAIGFSNSGDQIDEFIKIVPIINQTLAGLNMIGTIGDFYMSKETDSISISKGNGHFVNVEQVDLPGVGNSIIKNNNRIIKLKLTNQSQLKLYNVWLGFDIYAFDRSTNKYLKVENTKTPVEDPISFGGTGKIGKINFPQQSRDIEPGQSVDFISDSYSFSQSVTGHNYRADNIPYKYVFSAWSSGYPGQLNPSEAVRLSYENVSIPFYITDDIAPKVPIVSIEQVNSNGLFTFFSWKIADEDTFDIDKAQIYVDGNLWKELDARIFKSAVCPITDTIQQLKMKLTDIGGNESTFSNAIVVDVKEIDDKRPKEYSLSQNYPNPFNPTTAILYQIPVESHVTLKVYDLLGRELEVLVNEEKPAGFYDVKYNASSLSSGIYFYTIKAGDFVQTKKFILLK